MNTYRKAKKAREIGDYYLYKKNPKRSNDLKGIKSYKRAISFQNERYRYSEDVLYGLSKLYYYSGFHEKSLNTINTCLDYSGGYVRALEFKCEILEGMGKQEAAIKVRTIYEYEFKKYNDFELDLDRFYKSK